MIFSHDMKLLRAARLIHDCLAKQTERSYVTAPDDARWRKLDFLIKRRNSMLARRWQAATTHLEREIVSAAGDIRSALTLFESQFKSRSPEIASPRQIYRDLAALSEEFDNVGVDLQRRCVWVVTDPIELDEVYLGSFRIELYWRSILTDETGRYCIIAEDPNEASNGDGVTHPHVLAGVLCEGEGKLPIQKALTQGRILDFFLIVRNVLNTYNAESAYVTISNWHGLPCADCGDVRDDDEIQNCDDCECTICDECRRPCCDCSNALCGECYAECVGCRDDFCKKCVKDCECCGASICTNCVSDLNYCEECHEKATENGPTADPQVQPDSVGETVVSA